MGPVKSLPGRLALWAHLGVALAVPTAAMAVQPGDAPPARTPMASMRTCAKECHQEIFAHKSMHGPALTNCGACHVQGNPEEHKFYLIREKGKLCLGCHQLPHAGVEHKPVREGQCLECHDPHGSEHPRNLVADPKRELCARCHAGKGEGKEFVHGPLREGACIVCHQPHTSAQAGLLLKPQRELCLSCHEEVALRAEGTGMHRHAAFEDSCTRCHDPHASDHRHQLVQEAPGLCLSCHQEAFDRMVGGAKVVHGAVTSPGGCTGCHEPHASRLTGLQRGSQPDLCLSCHDKVVGTAQGEQLTDMARLLAENPDHHGPIREGQCTSCHSPHASDHFRLLVEDYPKEFYAPFDLERFRLCFKCHIPDLVLKPSGQGLTNFRDGDRNLHYLHVNQEKGRTCRACHEVHASKRPSHVRDAVPFGSGGWMLEINFQTTAQGGSCAPGCHQKKEYSRLPAEGPASNLIKPAEKTP